VQPKLVIFPDHGLSSFCLSQKGKGQDAAYKTEVSASFALEHFPVAIGKA
jgi:hypothetical protein